MAQPGRTSHRFAVTLAGMVLVLEVSGCATASPSATASSGASATLQASSAASASSLPASEWRAMPAGELYVSPRGFSATAPSGWFVIEPSPPPDSNLTAVLSPAKAAWENGADNQEPIVYVFFEMGTTLEALQESFSPLAWNPTELAGVAGQVAVWDPDASSSWGGRMALIPEADGIWIIRAHVPEGAQYQITQDAVSRILASFSPMRAGE